MILDRHCFVSIDCSVPRLHLAMANRVVMEAMLSLFLLDC